MTDQKKSGLYLKYDVQRTDGRDDRGEKHHGCDYFVLDMTHDKHALAAIAAYTASCEAEYPLLARDLRAKYLSGAAASSGKRERCFTCGALGCAKCFSEHGKHCPCGHGYIGHVDGVCQFVGCACDRNDYSAPGPGGAERAAPNPTPLATQAVEAKSGPAKLHSERAEPECAACRLEARDPSLRALKDHTCERPQPTPERKP